MKSEVVKYQNNILDYNEVSNLLTNIWTSLEEDGQNISTIKKIYSVSNECLENIYKHSDFVNEFSVVNFLLEKNTNSFIITSSNPIVASKKEIIQDKIENLSKLDNSGLKDLYQNEIKRRSSLTNGGAGLGLIIIARKSNNQINLEIKEINKDLSLVLFTIEVPF